MSALSELYPLVRQRCPGVIDFMMLDALVSAYREFCEKSEFLRHDCTFDVVQADQPYTLTIPDGFAFVNISHVTMTGSSGSKQPLFSGDNYQFDLGTKQVQFSADYSGCLVQVVIKPKVSFDETLADEYLIENFGEAIAAGAVSILRKQRGEKWFSPDLAAEYRAEFVEGFRDAYRLRQEEFSAFRKKRRKRTFY